LQPLESGEKPLFINKISTFEQDPGAENHDRKSGFSNERMIRRTEG